MPIASQAYTIGDVVAYSRSAQTVIPVTSGTLTTDLFGVAMETKLSTDTTLLVAIFSPRQRWVATSTNAPSTSHNFQRMVMTDARTVNNTGTDSTTDAALFTQVGVASVANSQIIVTPNVNAGVGV